MGRSLRTQLDMLRPNISARVESKQLSQKSSHDAKARERSFQPQDNVYVREAGTSSPWVPGTIEQKQGCVHYGVRLESGRLVRRHIDHIQSRTPGSNETLVQQQEETPELLDISSPLNPALPNEQPAQQAPRVQELPRRSARIRNQPNRFGNLVPS